jgi:hypothetical protein
MWLFLLEVGPMYDVTALAELADDDCITVPPGASSLAFLQAIYRSTEQPMVRRMKAAIAALPFEHPRLAVTAVLTDEDLGARLHRAIQRSAKVIELRAAQEPMAPSNGHDTTASAVSAAAVRTPLVSYRRR